MIFANKQARRDKHLLRLERERRRLWQVSADAPLIEVEHPFQRGWVKSYTLRDDITRRRDASVFRRILEAINVRVYCRNRNFVDARGRPIPVRPKIIPAREWPKLQWPENHKRHFFYGYWKQPICMYSYSKYIFGYKLACEWLLEEHIEPFIVTHVRADLPAVRKRLAEINAYFEKHCGSSRLDRLHGNRRRCWLSFQWSAAELRSAASRQDFAAGSF